MIVKFISNDGEESINFGEIQEDGTLPIWTEGTEPYLGVDINLDEYDVKQLIQFLNARYGQITE